MNSYLQKLKAVSNKEWDQLTGIGIYATLGWFSVIGTLFFINGYSFYKLTANELGDFLAGSVAPVAFFWLIIGYFQQGKEIRDLKIHAGRTATATEAGVALQEKEIDMEVKEGQPQFIYLNCSNRSTGGGDQACQVHFENQGSTAINLNFTTQAPDEVVKVSNFPKDPINNTKRGTLTFHYNTTNDLPQEFELTYFDLKGKAYQLMGDLGINDIENRGFFSEPMDL